MGGRIAFVVAPDYDPNMTAVRLFNGFRCPTGTEPSTSGCMPPPPDPQLLAGGCHGLIAREHVRQ